MQTISKRRNLLVATLASNLPAYRANDVII